jgi:hypothetical protein
VDTIECCNDGVTLLVLFEAVIRQLFPGVFLRPVHLVVKMMMTAVDETVYARVTRLCLWFRASVSFIKAVFAMIHTIWTGMLAGFMGEGGGVVLLEHVWNFGLCLESKIGRASVPSFHFVNLMLHSGKQNRYRVQQEIRVKLDNTIKEA